MHLKNTNMKSALMCHRYSYSEEQFKGKKKRKDLMSAESIWVAGSCSNVHSLS